jgi:hypothetical protein
MHTEFTNLFKHDETVNDSLRICFAITSVGAASDHNRSQLLGS